MAKGTYASINLATERPRRHLRAAAGRRRRGRPGADRPAVRRPRLRRPRSRGQPDPHPGAAAEPRMATTTEHAAPRVARRRQPRPDPRARRAREQPQGRQRRDPEAPADGVHRRLRLGQELAGVRHDRRGVAAADQRDLQRLRAGLHADAGAARGRRARRADDGDHRRPGADGRRPALHGRHRHRRQRDAAHPLQPARQAAHRLAQAFSFNVASVSGERRDHGRARRQDRDREGDASAAPAACARAARAGARSPTST